MKIRFPALLEDEKGLEIVYGSAEIAPEPYSLNFISGFIPLYPIGTKVSVVPLKGDNRDDNRSEKLLGEVYLSSRSLLRITDIDKSKMERIYEVFESNTTQSSEPYIPAPESLLTKLFHRKSAGVKYRVNANIYYISESEIKFLSIDPVECGAVMILDLEKPLGINNISIEIREVCDFGNIMKAYLCNVISAPEQFYNFASSLADEAACSDCDCV